MIGPNEMFQISPSPCLILKTNYSKWKPSQIPKGNHERRSKERAKEKQREREERERESTALWKRNREEKLTKWARKGRKRGSDDFGDSQALEHSARSPAARPWPAKSATTKSQLSLFLHFQYHFFTSVYLCLRCCCKKAVYSSKTTNTEIISFTNAFSFNLFIYLY